MAKDATVTITLNRASDPPQPVLVPADADIEGPGKATWVAVACNVSITFAEQDGEKGPFPAQNTDDNPGRGVYECDDKSVTSDPAAYDTNGKWAYTVTDEDGGGQANGSIVVGGNP